MRNNEGTRFTTGTHIELQSANKELKGEWAIMAARKSREEAEKIAKTVEDASYETGHAVAPVEVVKSPEELWVEEISKNGVVISFVRNQEILENSKALKDAA